MGQSVARSNNGFDCALSRLHCIARFTPLHLLMCLLACLLLSLYKRNMLHSQAIVDHSATTDDKRRRGNQCVDFMQFLLLVIEI